MNPYGPSPLPNPYFGSISPNGLNLGLLNVNPLVSFQVSKNEYGEKLLKPLVNLHVTPNENLIHKVGSLFHAKKHGFGGGYGGGYGHPGGFVNKHEHFHTHYPAPPSVYHPGHSHHYDGPYRESPPHHYEEYPHHHHSGPGYYNADIDSTPGGYGLLNSGPGQYRDTTGPSAASVGGDYQYESDPNEYYSRSINATAPGANLYSQYNYQDVYPQNQDRFSPSQPDDPNSYANNYQYNNQLGYNDFQRTESQAPGAARGSKTVSFPNSRRRRNVDSEDKDIEENKEESEIEGRSVKAEKV